MKVLILIIIWLVGVVLALCGEKRLREYKDYDNPKLYLTMGIILCVLTSWLMVFGALVNGTFEFPRKGR